MRTRPTLLTFAAQLGAVARIYSLGRGARIPEAILSIAERERIRTARVEAIGGVDRLTVGYFNHRKKRYEEHDHRGFLEVTSILGNITLKDGRPFLHIHGTFAKKGCSIIGGHILSATVMPLLEVVITPTENVAEKKFDEETGFNVIYRVNGKTLRASV